MRLDVDDKLTDDTARIAAARRLNIFDTPRERAFDHITRLVRVALKVPIASVSLIDEDRQWFKSVDGLDATETPIKNSFCAVTIRQRGPMVIGDALSDPDFRDHPAVAGEPGLRCYAGAPLVLPDGYQVGALCAAGFEAREFSEMEISMLTQLAECVVHEMELRQRASIDTMTGFMSRAPFLKRLDTMIARNRQTGTPSVLAILDLDRFKSINDSFGHPVGDRVLEAVAETCRTVLDERSHLGRLGGEEFALLFAGAELGETITRLEALRLAIEAIRFDDLPKLHVTASFGVAPLDAAVANASTWCKLADAALYSAKQNGRNRVMVAGAASVSAFEPENGALPFVRELEADRLDSLTSTILKKAH